jgi:hypothetical protein
MIITKGLGSGLLVTQGYGISTIIQAINPYCALPKFALHKDQSAFFSSRTKPYTLGTSPFSDVDKPTSPYPKRDC